MDTTRRIFMLRVAAAGSALAVSTGTHAQAKVDEKDPQAVALGYVDDTKRADDKKFPKHSPDQKCANCQLFTGKAADATGGCALFAGKLVAANGWCSAWTKKA